MREGVANQGAGSGSCRASGRGSGWTLLASAEQLAWVAAIAATSLGIALLTQRVWSLLPLNVPVALPLTGVLLGLLLLDGRRARIWAVLAGVFLGELLFLLKVSGWWEATADDWKQAVLLAAAWPVMGILLWRVARAVRIRTVDDLLQTVGMAKFVTVVSACAVLFSVGWIAATMWILFPESLAEMHAEHARFWVLRGLSDWLGIVLTTPIFLVLRPESRQEKVFRWAWQEATLMVIGASCAAWVLLRSESEHLAFRLAFSSALVPVLMVVAARQGPALATLATLVAFGIAIEATNDGIGLFAGLARSGTDRLLALQATFGLVGTAVVLLGCSMQHQRRETAAAQQSRANYRSIFEGCHDAVLVFRPDAQRIIEANRHAADLYGYPIEEFIGLHLDAISLEPETRPGRIAATMRTGSHEDFRTKQRRRDGTAIDLSIRAMLIEYAGAPAILSFNHDITDRVAAEESAREVEQRFRMIAERLPGLIYSYKVFDDGRREPRYKSPSFKEFCAQYPGLDLCGEFRETILPHIHTEDRQRYTARVLAIRQSRTMFDLEYRLVCPNGQVRWVHSMVSPVVEADGVIWLALMLDVTEGKAATQALAASEARYRDFIRRATEGVGRIDMDGGVPVSAPVDEQIRMMMDRGRFSECNDAMAQMYGLASADLLVGTALRDVFPTDNPVNRSVLRRFIEGGYALNAAESIETDAAGNPRRFVTSYLGVVADDRLVSVWGTQRDVTEMYRVQQDLVQARERLELAIAGSSDGVFDCDLRSGAMYSSETLMTLLRRESLPETLDEWTRLVHPADMARFEGMFNGEHQSGEPFDVECRVASEKGEWVWLRFRGDVIRDAFDEPVRVAGTARDVTARLAAQLAVEESRRLIESIWRAQGEYMRGRDVVRGCEALLGILIRSTGSRSGAVVGFERETNECRVLAVSDGESPQRGADGVREKKFSLDAAGGLMAGAVERGEVVEGAAGEGELAIVGIGALGAADHQTCVPLRSGEMVVGVVILVARGERGGEDLQSANAPVLSTLTTMVAAHRDSDRRAAAERALQASEARQREILSSIPDAIIRTDSASLVIELNPTALAIIGLARADTIGRPLDELLPAPIAAAASVASGEESGARRTRFTEVSSMDAEGRRDIRECRVIPVGTDGFLVVIRDITQRRVAEENERALTEQLRQVQKLESLGVLAGGIAHDFNNLLVGVMGAADLAASHVSRDSPAAGLLDDVVTAARHGTHLTRQLLSYAGQREVRAQTVDCKELIRAATPLMRATLRRSAVLDVAVGTVDLPVAVDRTQFEQVLVNLVGNASDAVAESGGRVSVRCGVRTLGAADLHAVKGATLVPGMYAAVEVVDNGSGMSDEVKARMFEPFYSTRFAGRGLGLGVVMGIVKAHRGGLLVRSTLEQGSSITVLLPIASETPVPEARQPSVSEVERVPLKGRGTALVVEDDAMVRKIATRLLEAGGWSVESAETGAAAAEMVRANPDGIDIALVDLAMPGLNGLETMKVMRRWRPNLRIILTSGFAPEAKEMLASDAHASFLAKPYSGQQLLAAFDAMERRP